MKRTITYHIEQAHVGLSIYDFLKQQDYSSQSITLLKRMDHNVCVQGNWVYMNYILKLNDILTIHINEETTSENIVPVSIPLEIVYEDEDILVINKQANLPIHPSQNHYEDTLANGVAYYYGRQHLSYTFRCINRIDKDTTGLTLLAKHLVSASILGKMVQNRTIKREYLAIVHGAPTPLIGTINAPIGRVDSSTIMREINYQHGESAITHYKTICSKDEYSLLSLSLETGRTHQIRVHMKSIGCPLVGDFLYNQASSALSHQALHSARLSFIHPIKKEPLVLEALFPSEWNTLFPNIISY